MGHGMDVKFGFKPNGQHPDNCYQWQQYVAMQRVPDPKKESYKTKPDVAEATKEDPWITLSLDSHSRSRD
jgi:hypothetical protein